MNTTSRRQSTIVPQSVSPPTAVSTQQIQLLPSCTMISSLPRMLTTFLMHWCCLAFDAVDQHYPAGRVAAKIRFEVVVLRCAALIRFVSMWAISDILCQRPQFTQPVCQRYSVLGHLKFIVQTKDGTRIFDRYSLRHLHLFADDKQAYTSETLSNVFVAASPILATGAHRVVCN